jgi:hypothetical protein
MSNHTNDPWEAEMSRTFDQRVRDLHEAPLSFDQVRGKATRIRRTRRLAATGGALAAAAVIVPIVVFAGGALTDDSGPDPAPQPNPRVTDPAGSGFDYIEGKTIHLADGMKIIMPDRYVSAAVLGETVFGVRSDDETGQRYLDVTGDEVFPTQTTEIISGPVVNDDHTVVAYIEGDGDLVTHTGNAATTLATGLGPNSQLTALTGGPDCATDPCRAYVDDDTLDGPRVYENGGTSAPVEDAIGVQDASEAGLLTVQKSYSDQGSCGGIYDLASASYLWETCDHFLFGLSPDSAYVDATHAYLDGYGNGYAAILDVESQQEVARLEPVPGGSVLETTWQDNEHLLALVNEPDGWSVYRLGIDGTAERVLGPSPKGSEFAPWFGLVNGS